MISFKQSGSFNKTYRYLNRIQQLNYAKKLDKYGRDGVAALASATPVDTGLTASSWDYGISVDKDSVVISFYNANIRDGCPIAVIIQYGHGTCNGGWVQGIDYVNPAIRPIFEQMANDVWEEVTKT